MRKLFPLFLLVLVACADPTGPDPVDPVTMRPIIPMAALEPLPEETKPQPKPTYLTPWPVRAQFNTLGWTDRLALQEGFGWSRTRAEAFIYANRNYMHGGGICAISTDPGDFNSARCWTALLYAIGAVTAQGAACTAASASIATRNAKIIQTAFAGCMTAIGYSIETIDKWSNMPSPNDEAWRDEQMHNQACKRMGREAGC